MTESDASLVARTRLGDAAAFELLLRRFFRTAYLVALAQVGNEADAEDVCQEAFVRAWTQIDSCRDPSKFGAWLTRIVRNSAYNRREYLHVRQTEPEEFGANVPSSDASDSRLIRGELRTRLSDALSRVTPVQREVVLLHDLEGCHHAEIASQLELSVAMSRRHLSDARKTLRSLLGDYSAEESDND